jgi:hypothetical protein
MVNGAGNSSTLLHYSFRDSKPLKGLNYYGLQQVDFDGTVSWSEVVAFTNKTSGAFKLFPNPTSGIFTLYSTIQYGQLFVRIYDVGIRLSNR